MADWARPLQLVIGKITLRLAYPAVPSSNCERADRSFLLVLIYRSTTRNHSSLERNGFANSNTSLALQALFVARQLQVNNTTVIALLCYLYHEKPIILSDIPQLSCNVPICSSSEAMKYHHTLHDCGILMFFKGAEQEASSVSMPTRSLFLCYEIIVCYEIIDQCRKPRTRTVRPDPSINPP